MSAYNCACRVKNSARAVHRCSTDVHDSTVRRRETSMACWKPEERLSERGC